ncbi:MAG: ATP-binding protein [Anaerolineales bacterium]
MRARLLVFDPDIEGRRLMHAALSRIGLDLSIILRSSGKTAASALESMEFDCILVGLPVELEDLIPFLTQLQNLDQCPPLIFLCSEPSPEGQWLPKDENSLQDLRQKLLPEIRAYRIQRAAASLQACLDQVERSARSQLANQVVDLLGALEFPAIYASVDAVEFHWNLRSSSYPSGMVAEILAITEEHGGVATQPHRLSGPLKRLIAGEIDDHTFAAADLLTTLMPTANIKTIKRLISHLDVSEIHTVAIHKDNRLKGFLLIGCAPQPSEQKALLNFGEQFGRLLTEAEEYDLLKQQARSMRALQEMMLSLSATLDPGSLLDAVLEKLEMVVPFDLAGIALRERDGLRVHASRGQALDFRLMDPTDSDTDDLAKIIQWLLEQVDPVLAEADDLGRLFGFKPEELRFESWIGVPISWGEDQLGYLFVASEEAGHLEAVHLEIAIGFARQLAVALQNARLIQASHERAEKLKLVNDIGQYAISVLDPQQLVEEVASRVYEVFDYFAVRILFVEGDDLVPYALSGAPDNLTVEEDEPIALEEVQEIALAVEQDEPVFLDASSPRWGEIMPAQLAGAKAAIFIPLSVVSEVIGIMEIYAQTARALGKEDVEVLEVLAAQIAISVVNARLFNEIRSHAIELESRVEMRTHELQSQKERTEAILRSVADAILVLDLDGEVVLANPTGQELLDGDQGASLYDSLRNLFVAEGVVQSSVEIGEVTFQALASPVELEGDARGTVIVLRDITRMKELDQLKNQFVATVSHELRTPLTNIKLYLSLLRSADEEKRARYHKVLVRETERLSDMIENLLDLSRLESQGTIEKDEVELNGLLQLVADNHEPACISKGIAFSTDFRRRAVILADQAQIIQVFTNLLANAIAYTPVGGEIALNIAGLEEIEGQQYAKVVLEDTGIGIRKEDLPHVFDRFYRGEGVQKYQAEGSGLGLAIVREILDNHNAKVAVDSQPGEGTKFTLWLPAMGE